MEMFASQNSRVNHPKQTQVDNNIQYKQEDKLWKGMFQ